MQTKCSTDCRTAKLSKILASLYQEPIYNKQNILCTEVMDQDPHAIGCFSTGASLWSYMIYLFDTIS